MLEVSFFFRAEGGIRDGHVTGVQTCALPIYSGAMYVLDDVLTAGWAIVASDYTGLGTPGSHPYLIGEGEGRSVIDAVRAEIGRASCRERGEREVGGASRREHRRWTAAEGPAR